MNTSDGPRPRGYDGYQAEIAGAEARSLAAALSLDDPTPVTFGGDLLESVPVEDQEIVLREIRATAAEIVPVGGRFPTTGAGPSSPVGNRSSTS